MGKKPWGTMQLAVANCEIADLGATLVRLSAVKCDQDVPATTNTPAFSALIVVKGS